ncbi:MAG: hypothetical protein J6M19_03240 [Bacteroidaceae bacterium]|nr:hypothetical protein [Bacteroidaceae bacterium]
MKKVFLSMMSILMVAMLCVGFASCSKDDDNAGSLAYDANNPIVGGWYHPETDEDSEILFLLYPNGNFKLLERVLYRHNGNYGYNNVVVEGRYEYEDGTLYLTITKSNDADILVGIMLEMDVVSLGRNRLVVESYNDDYDDFVETSFVRTEQTSL